MGASGRVRRRQLSVDVSVSSIGPARGWELQKLRADVLRATAPTSRISFAATGGYLEEKGQHHVWS